MYFVWKLDLLWCICIGVALYVFVGFGSISVYRFDVYRAVWGTFGKRYGATTTSFLSTSVEQWIG